jgi:phosphomannomutase
MKINPNIFKSYDIRGIYPKELDEKTAYIIGKAFVEHTKAKKVVIGRDSRLAGEELLKSLTKGMNEMGADVSNIGQVPTECVYFSVGNYNFDAGVMITASHNPKEYNGFKMLKKDGKNINIIRGKDLLSIVTEKEIIGDKKGEIKEKDIWQDFSSYILAFADLSKIMPLKIVIDASNGVAGKAIEKIQDNLPVEIIPLNFEPNGNFPDHSPNPLEKGSSDKISEIIKKEKADFGLIFVGDADRVFLLDEN